MFWPWNAELFQALFFHSPKPTIAAFMRGWAAAHPLMKAAPCVSAGITHSLVGQHEIHSPSLIWSFLKMGPLSRTLFLDRKGVSQHLKAALPPAPSLCPGSDHRLSFYFPPTASTIKGRLLLCECSDARYNIKTFHPYPRPAHTLHTARSGGENGGRIRHKDTGSQRVEEGKTQCDLL